MIRCLSIHDWISNLLSLFKNMNIVSCLYCLFVHKHIVHFKHLFYGIFVILIMLIEILSSTSAERILNYLHGHFNVLEKSSFLLSQFRLMYFWFVVFSWHDRCETGVFQQKSPTLSKIFNSHPSNSSFFIYYDFIIILHGLSLQDVS